MALDISYSAIDGQTNGLPPRYPNSDLADAVRAFLGALDRGYLGWDAQIGPSYDRAETAFVTGLRESLAQHEAQS
jgi:hypothetical protein